MLQNRLIPILLLKGGGLYKTKRFKDPNYIGDPRNAIKIFNEKGVDEICLLDIDATKDNFEPNFELIEELASECFIPLSYGGGIKNLEQIKRLFSIGVEKVILNSICYTDYDLIRTSSSIFGDQSIVASIDVKKDFFNKYKLFSNSGTKKEKISLKEHLSKVIESGIGEIIVTSIGHEGLMKGMDLDLIKFISQSVDVPVVGVGGVGSLEDIKDGIDKGLASAIGVGSFVVYHGKHNAVLITYPTRMELNKIFK